MFSFRNVVLNQNLDVELYNHLEGIFKNHTITLLTKLEIILKKKNCLIFAIIETKKMYKKYLVTK